MENPITLRPPLQEADVRNLKAGERVLVSGIIYTARDQVHKLLFEKMPEELKKPLHGSIIYHCGPIVKDGKILSAGPTTSIREEPYEAELIRRYTLRAIIGKGGMGEKTLRALIDNGAVYLATTGGAGALLSESVKRIKSVRFEEFGPPEAMYELVVENLLAIVAMDSHGKSLYDAVLRESQRNLEKL